MAVDTGTAQVVMPAMGDSVAEGTVLEWHKQEGDAVAADETIVEISTDKVDAEVPAPVAGTIAKIHAAEGDTVAVGAVLAEIVTNGNGLGDAPTAPRRRGRDAVSGESPATTPGEAAAGAATEAGAAPAEPAAGQTSRSSPRRAVSRSPRARSSSGRSRSATGLRRRHRGRDLH